MTGEIIFPWLYHSCKLDVYLFNCYICNKLLTKYLEKLTLAFEDTTKSNIKDLIEKRRKIIIKHAYLRLVLYFQSWDFES